MCDSRRTSTCSYHPFSRESRSAQRGAVAQRVLRPEVALPRHLPGCRDVGPSQGSPGQNCDAAQLFADFLRIICVDFDGEEVDLVMPKSTMIRSSRRETDLMRRSLRIATAGAGVMGLAAAGAASATPATAADPAVAPPATAGPAVIGDCQGNNKFCFWKDGNFNGEFWSTTITSGFANIPFGASSWKNTRTDRSMCVYEVPILIGPHLIDKVPPQTQRPVVPVNDPVYGRVEPC